MQHLLEHREQFKQLRRDRCAAGLSGQAHAQVVFDGEAGKDFAALRHIANARSGALVGFGVGQVLACQAHTAALDGHQAHQAFEQRGFAHAVAAQQHCDLTLFSTEAHITQDVGAAIVLVDVLNGQHLQRPK